MSRSHALLLRQVTEQHEGGHGQRCGAGATGGRHRAGSGNALRAGVLGANDGLVSNLSLVMGVAGLNSDNAPSSSRAWLAARRRVLHGPGEWLSVQSSASPTNIRCDREGENPWRLLKRSRELALIYEARGLPADEARRLAGRSLQDPMRLSRRFAREELNVDPAELGGSAWVARDCIVILFALGRSSR